MNFWIETSRTRQRGLSLSVAIALLGFSAFEGANAQSAGDALPFWTNSQVPVCWEERDTQPKDRELVQQEINTTWGRHSNITFTGWGFCDRNSGGIRISVNDSFWPKVLRFGRFLSGAENGMLLNFNMNRPEIAPRCINRKDYCIKVAAVHEFGHALGFFHQYNASDGQITVKCQREPSAAEMPEAHLMGKSDFYSVMNICNPRWNGNGELSQGDILALQRIYNTPASDAIKTPVLAQIGLQTAIQPGANGRNRMPIDQTDLAYTQDHLMLISAIYLNVSFADGSTAGPHHYHKKFAENVIFDDVSGDPNDLIKIIYWNVDHGDPGLGQYAAQLTTTGNGVGTAELRVSFANAPDLTSSVPVEVIGRGQAQQAFTSDRIPVAASFGLQSAFQPGANGRNVLPLNRNSRRYLEDGLDLFPAIYLSVTFADGQTEGASGNRPVPYQMEHADNVIFDDVSGDPNDLIEVVYWPIDDTNPARGEFAAQVTSTGRGTGTAELLVSFRNAPSVVERVTVEVAD